MAVSLSPSSSALSPSGICRPLSALLAAIPALEASDLHVSAGRTPHVRVHGELQELAYEGASVAVPDGDDFEDYVSELLSAEEVARWPAEFEIDKALMLPSGERFRCNFAWAAGQGYAAFRWIPARVRTIRELGLPAVVETLTRTPRGLILFTGPTGSGKSTSLAAMIDHINRTRSGHIVTIEDPIEYLHRDISCVIHQREIGGEADVASFASGLRAALRQDPDVILLGEMRDAETMSTALRAAETGHLVLSTVHSNSAAETVERIVDSFEGERRAEVRKRLSVSLRAAVAQTLVPTADGRGRVAALEVMTHTSAVATLIKEGKTAQLYNTIASGSRYGMQTMEQALHALYATGEITLEEAFKAAVDRRELASLLTELADADPDEVRSVHERYELLETP